MQVRDIIQHLETNNVTLPNGGRLTVSRWQQLGLDFGQKGQASTLRHLVGILNEL